MSGYKVGSSKHLNLDYAELEKKAMKVMMYAQAYGANVNNGTITFGSISSGYSMHKWMCDNGATLLMPHGAYGIKWELPSIPFGELGL